MPLSNEALNQAAIASQNVGMVYPGKDASSAVPGFESYISGVKKEVTLINGAVRKFRYDNLLNLRWVSDSDGSYIRPDVNGEWVRKKRCEKYRLSNLKVDRDGTLTYDRIIDDQVVHFIEDNDLSAIGLDNSGRIVRIDYPNNGFSQFQYNSHGQICKFIAPDGSVWNSNDELIWRRWPTCRQDLHGIMEIEDDGTVKFLNFTKRKGFEFNLSVFQLNGMKSDKMPVVPALTAILESNFDKLPKNEDGTIEIDVLYKTVRDLPVCGTTRMAAMMLWDYAHSKGLRRVAKEQIQDVTAAPDYAERFALLMSKTIHLRNIFREEDNLDIKRVGRYRQLRAVLTKMPARGKEAL